MSTTSTHHPDHTRTPQSKLCLLFFLLVLQGPLGLLACGPGPMTFGNRHGPPVVKTLKLWERLPKLTEDAYGASGASDGPISRGTEMFGLALSVNEEKGLRFKTDDARYMTKVSSFEDYSCLSF